MIETVAPLPALRHLARLSDAVGIFKHAKLDCPRPECGYCTDDAGRLLAIATWLASDANAPLLAEVALGFLERAHVGGDRFRSRQGVDNTWTNDRPSDDAAGRALLSLGRRWRGRRGRTCAIEPFCSSVKPRTSVPNTLAPLPMPPSAPSSCYRLYPTMPMRAAWSATPRTACPAGPPTTRGRGPSPDLAMPTRCFRTPALGHLGGAYVQESVNFRSGFRRPQRLRR